jgi:hypothetical protein
MDSANASAAPVTYPVFAAVALGITGSSVYQVIDLVGGMFEAAGAVFEGSPDAPGTLLALLPPSDRAAMAAVQLGLQAQAAAPSLRLGVDATEVHTKKEQDAKWQQVIDSAIRLQKAARSGEAIAGESVEHLTHGAIATEALQVGQETFLLLTGLRDLAAVHAADPEPAPTIETVAPTAPRIEPEPTPTAPVSAPDPVAVPTPDPVPVSAPDPVPIPVSAPPVTVTVAPEPATPSPAPIADTPSTMHATARWDGRLIGREEHLADLRARFERVVADRTVSCVLVTGEPGVGRSRLVRAFVDACPDGTMTRHVACPPTDDGGGRWPMAALVEAATGLGPLAFPDIAAERLERLFAGEPDAGRVVPQLTAMVALDGRVQTDEVRWTLRRALEVSTGDVPTVIHIDDVDRVGAGFVRLVADVAAASRGAPIMFVLTSRRETDALPAIRLTPLTAEAGAELVTDLLGAVEPGLAGTIASRANGDPFLIEQTLATLSETGTLAPGQGRWMALADLATVPLPDGPIGVIRRRLQSLPPHALAVLGVAAVAGERFEASPLADVIPEEAATGMSQHLAELTARGFVVAEGDGRYRFRHALIREATTGGVPDWARAAMHRRVAREAERHAGERMWRMADTIGDHLAAASELTSDASATERDEAIELLTWSAAAAVEQGDLEGAARLERRAAGLLDHDPERRAELLYLAAEHDATAAPDRPADREIAEAALAASVAADDVDWRVRLLRARLRTSAGHEDALEGARTTADEAIAAFGEDEMTWAVSCAWALRGQVHAARAQNGLVADDLLRAADHAAAVGRWREETQALRGAAAALLGGPVGVAEAEARCRGYLERVRGPLAEHDIRSAVALLQARRSAFEDARASIANSASVLDELGAARDLAIVLHRVAEIEVLAGQPHAAEPQMQRALAAATNARDEGLRASLAGSFAHILVADDERLDEALALADVAEAHALDIAANVGWRMARARVLVRRGRGQQAERLVRQGLSLAEQTDSTDLRANTLVYAADVRRWAGRPAEAEPFERRALRLFERRGATAQAAAVAAILRPVNDGSATGSEPEDAKEMTVEETAAGRAPAAGDAAAGDEAPPVEPAANGAGGLADEMMALFAGEDVPTPDAAPGPAADAAAEPMAPTFVAAPDDDGVGPTPGPEAAPSPSATQESHRRWFTR